MKRNPFKQYIKDPDNRAKLFLGMTGAMILSTILIVIGTFILIFSLTGII